MNEPVFLELDQVLEIHQDSIEAFGGTHGIRDRGLLEGAVNQPKNIFFYGGGDLFDIAAGYAFHIAEVQSLLDGNKRTAMGSALIFLAVNGVAVDYDWKLLYDAMIALADGRLDRAGLAAMLRGENTD